MRRPPERWWDIEPRVDALSPLETAGDDSHHDAAPGYRRWAADKGCYAQGDTFDPMDWFIWLAGLPDVAVRRRCLFASAPDVLVDAEATWERSMPWLSLIRNLGIPAAVVAQNGAEDHAPLWDNADLWDVLFVGGDTAWKLSDDAHDVVREAQLLGKWVHVGRVNSWRRRCWPTGTSTRWAAPTCVSGPTPTAASSAAGWPGSTPNRPCSARRDDQGTRST